MENEGKQGKKGKGRRGDEKERGEAHAGPERPTVIGWCLLFLGWTRGSGQSKMMVPN